MLYRIYTENKNREQVVELVAKRFDGFTVFEAEGYWKGQQERSLIIEIVPNIKYPEYKIEGLALDIRTLNQQESVLIQQVECESWLV